MATLLDLFDRVTVMEDFARVLEGAEITDANLDMENNEVSLKLKSAVLLDADSFFGFIDRAKSYYSLKELNADIVYENIEFDEGYGENLIKQISHYLPNCRMFLSQARAELCENVIHIKGVHGGREILKESNAESLAARIASGELSGEFLAVVEYEDFDKEAYIKERDRITQEKAAAAAAFVGDKSEVVSKKPALSSGHIFGTPIKESKITPMIDIVEGMGIVVISGEIIDCEVRALQKNGKPTGNMVADFDLGDDNWAVSCHIFSKAEKFGKAEPHIKKGNRLKVRGEYKMDDYAHECKFNVISMELLEKPPIRMDEAEEKRVELHLHTKMSAKDAITSASDLINRAAKWGHSAIAITDHGVAQAFPEAQSTAGKIAKSGGKIKILYGTEAYFVNDVPLWKNESWKGGTYVVFDLETTGLDPKCEKITEIGAIRVENGVTAKTFSALVNPGKPIPENITQLTGISDEMVASCPTIDEVLPKFLEFCGDAIAVAHNARFDTSFVKAEGSALGLEFNNKTMDTVELSKELFPQEKKHNLEVLSERLGISLENHHRAVDDATATAEAFIKMMNMKEEAGYEGEYYDITTRPEFLKQPYHHIIILAKNMTGIKNLYRLISKSNLNNFYKRPRIHKSEIMAHRDGLIIGSACEQGEVYKVIRDNRPREEVEAIASFYDYLEIQPLGNNDFMLREGIVDSVEVLKDINKQIVALGDRLNKKVVATCDVHFMDPEDALYRQVLQGAQGYSDADKQAPLYFRTTDEMLGEFDYLGEEKAYEVVVKNTNYIADMIADLKPLKSGSYPPSIENCEQDLEDMCHKKAYEVYGNPLPDIVKARMDRELGCILGYGYAVMYMIAHKLVKKSNEAGYLVGSRGSVGSSFAAFLAGITEVNALCPHYICQDCKHSEFFENGEYTIGIDMPDKVCPVCGKKMKKDGFNIPFETFLGFEGDKVPDIDLNFSGEYQATAHKYVEELFGEGYVFKAGTIGTIADKTAIGLAKKYYEKKGINAPMAEIKRVSRGMEDIKNTTGQHPGGVIVCPKTMDIHDFCPIQHPADKKDSGIITTHFDFHSIHDNLLKLDILGHDDPSTIRMLEDLTGVNALEIPLDDKETMSIFSSTDAIGVTPDQIDSKVGTFGIPEFGTSFTRQMLLDTLPTTFYELVIIAGLSHGTDVWLNNAQDLVKKGIATLSQVIGLRDDIMTYLILHGLPPKMAFTIMEFVRKGRAAKEGMPKEYEDAMIENNVPSWYIESCKKIKYMFPKAHAAAYVMMGFRVAYFKVHYPIEFYIAYFTVRADLFDAAIMAKGDEVLTYEMQKLKHVQNLSATEKSLYTIMELCHEMYQRGFEFLPVNIYQSHASKFKKVDGKILPPLNAFAGVGTAAAESIMAARENGEFISREDLKNRAKVNKSVMETLAQNGCLDGLPETSQISLFEM